MHPRPSQVRGLMNDPTYVDRILGRIDHWLGFNEIDGATVLDLLTQGTIPTQALEGSYVIRVEHSDGKIVESLAARVISVATGSGAMRLTLDPWKVFINHDPEAEPLQDGVSLWVGPTIRYIPMRRAA